MTFLKKPLALASALALACLALQPGAAFAQKGETVAPGLGTTTSSGRSSHLGWRQAMTAASCTAGWAMAMFSRSIELIHSPPDLMTSLERSVICM